MVDCMNFLEVNEVNLEKEVARINAELKDVMKLYLGAKREHKALAITHATLTTLSAEIPGVLTKELTALTKELQQHTYKKEQLEMQGAIARADLNCVQRLIAQVSGRGV